MTQTYAFSNCSLLVEARSESDWKLPSGNLSSASFSLSNDLKVYEKPIHPMRVRIAIDMYSQTRSGSVARGTKAWAIADEKACVNQKTPVTRARMFLGALV